MKHIKGLDTLRALAVIIVLTGHWNLLPAIGPVSGFIKQYFIPDGQAAVDLFFVLSGFLITGILLKEKEAVAGNRWPAIKKFIIRRALRIFPIYYLVVLLYIRKLLLCMGGAIIICII